MRSSSPRPRPSAPSRRRIRAAPTSPATISSSSHLFLAGERLDPDTYHWASQLLGVPVIDHWWQTETGWPIAANCIGIEPLPVQAGSPSKPVPGYDIRILDEGGAESRAGEKGAVAVRLPLPPGHACRRYGAPTNASSNRT